MNFKKWFVLCLGMLMLAGCVTETVTTQQTIAEQKKQEIEAAKKKQAEMEQKIEDMKQTLEDKKKEIEEQN